jgi:hypothetical protein
MQYLRTLRVAYARASLNLARSNLLALLSDVTTTGLPLGARGTSLIYSSGDSGVGDGDPNPKTHSCFTNDGKNRTQFIPAFPASCP